MYFDDRYHPTVDADNMSIESDSTYTVETRNSSVRRLRRDIADEIKRSDKGFFCYHSKSLPENGFKSYKIEMFDSGTCIGNRIRDPMSGARLSDRIGSKQEYQYFKVRMAGYKKGKSVSLFYDSPEQYERHHRCQLSQTVKEKWIQNKCLKSANE